MQIHYSLKTKAVPLLFLAYIAFSALDVAATYYGVTFFASRGIVEANHFALAAFTMFGVLGGAVLIKMVYVLLLVFGLKLPERLKQSFWVKTAMLACSNLLIIITVADDFSVLRTILP